MLITNNGNVEAVPHTSMVKTGGEWRYLLVCRVDKELTDEFLTDMFTTDTVKDDAVNAVWHYTVFDRITQDEGYKYVWMTYTGMEHMNETELQTYQTALNTLGVETQEVQTDAE